MPSIYIPPIVGNFDETSTSEETLRVLESKYPPLRFVVVVFRIYVLRTGRYRFFPSRADARGEYVLDILHVYTLEIQKCLTDTERIPSRCEYMMEHIVDELDYWKNRRKDRLKTPGRFQFAP